MPKLVRHLTPISLFTAVLCGHLVTTKCARGEPLRWKLTPGDDLNLQIVKETKGSAPAGTAMDMTLVERMDLIWRVADVGADGHAQIEQEIVRIRTNMTSGLGEIEYDSQQEPQGLAALAGPGLKVLTEHPTTFTLTARGAIVDVEMAEEVLEGLRNGPGVAALAGMLSAEGFQRTISQGLIVLPEEELTVGQEWSQSTEIDNSQFGRQAVNTTYRYDGEREVEGALFAVFAPLLEVVFVGEGPTPVEVARQSTSGEVLFDVAAGRLRSSRIEHQLVLILRVGEQTVEQQLDQTVTVDVSKAGGSGDGTEASG